MSKSSMSESPTITGWRLFSLVLAVAFFVADRGEVEGKMLKTKTFLGGGPVLVGLGAYVSIEAT